MKITVLIAAEAAGGLVATALASVASQAYFDWDLIVGSRADDELAQLVQRFANGRPGAAFLAVPGASGIAAIYNRLLESATGDAVAFLNGTDSWLPRHLTVAVQQLCSGADIVVSDARVHESGRFVGDFAVPKQVASSPLKTIFARDVIPSMSAVVVRRSVFARAGRLDESFSSGGIRDFLVRAAAAGARFSATHRGTCRHTRAALLPGALALKNAEESSQFYEKHRDLAAVPAALRRRLLAGSLVNHGRLLRASDPMAAALCFRRAWSLQPVHVQALGQYALTDWRFSGVPEKHD